MFHGRAAIAEGIAGFCVFGALNFAGGIWDRAQLPVEVKSKQKGLDLLPPKVWGYWLLAGTHVIYRVRGFLSVSKLQNQKIIELHLRPSSSPSSGSLLRSTLTSSATTLPSNPRLAVTASDTHSACLSPFLSLSRPVKTPEASGP